MTNALTASILNDLRVAGEEWEIPTGRPDHRAALYLRSVDPHGLKRQATACARLASARGLRIVGRFSDQAYGNATGSRGAALYEMLRAAARGEFGTLIVEDADRLSRDQSFLEEVCVCLDFLGITVHTPVRGELSPRQVLIRGVLAEEGRRLDLGRSRFMQRYMAKRGLVPGMPCYGYRTVQGRPGELAIDEGRASVVTRAFLMREAGADLGGIASALNRSPVVDVPWTADRVRSLLRNPLYGGLLVYGRSKKVRDPLTGRPKTVPAPRAEWIVTPVERLRLVDEATWEAVQASFGPRRLAA